MEEKKVEDILILHMDTLLPITSYFVIGTIQNVKQAQAVVEDIKKQGKQEGLSLWGYEGGGPEASWVLLDYGEVVIHLFNPESRLHYSLEDLWGDAPRVEWQSRTT